MEVLPPELTRKIQDTANQKGVAIISFIAPKDAVRISPAQVAYALITENEMYELEKTVKDARASSKKLHLVVHTPGGELYTSYKIAYFLRSSFENIEAFVPYEAASGGTMICCAANSLCLGELGNLTPIDPQTSYKDTRVSTYTFERAADFLKNLFGELSPAEVPTPYQQMADKLDPIIHNEMFVLTRNVYWYAQELLEKSKYSEEKAKDIAYRLARPRNPHSHPILSEEAKDIGFNVVADDGTMDSYQDLVAARLKEKSLTHCIDSFKPQKIHDTV